MTDLPFSITDEVLEQIEEHIARHPAERGGALLDHVDLPGTISLFIPDRWADVNPVEYWRSERLVEEVHLVERNSGHRLVGIVHSHPAGVDAPSGPDRRAFGELLGANPRLTAFAGPIVSAGTAREPHQVSLPSAKMGFFEARIVDGKIDVQPQSVSVVPIGAAKRHLADIGVRCGPTSAAVVGGAQCVAVDFLGQGDANPDVGAMYFPRGYPLLPPFVVRSRDGAAVAESLAWRIDLPLDDRLRAAVASLVPTAGASVSAPFTDITSRVAELVSPLSDRRVLVVGAGSVGSFLSEVLVRHGVGSLSIVDPERVEPANLSRSVYRWSDVGSAKVDALADRLRSIRPDVDVSTYAVSLESLGESWLSARCSEVDLVIGATDDVRTHLSLNAFAWSAGVPAVYPGVYLAGRAGEIVLAVPRERGVCWRCAILGAVAGSDGQRPHDYGTARTAVSALGADVWSISSIAAKACLALLDVTSGGSEELARWIAVPIARGSTLVQMATSPDWSYFPVLFEDVPGQWAVQSCWARPTSATDCPVCGEDPLPPRLQEAIDRSTLQELLESSVVLQGGGAL